MLFLCSEVSDRQVTIKQACSGSLAEGVVHIRGAGEHCSRRQEHGEGIPSEVQRSIADMETGTT